MKRLIKFLFRRWQFKEPIPRAMVLTRIKAWLLAVGLVLAYGLAGGIAG